MLIFSRYLLFATLSIVTLPVMVYLAFPGPDFPTQLPDSVQSLEEADTETPFRRAYFTNYDREEIVAHYKEQLKANPVGKLFEPLRLNYPPEDAYSIIRDQTRSSYLEELVYPVRESIYVNGFIPKENKDAIWYKGKTYGQKVTIKYSPSNPSLRVIISGIAILILLVIVWQIIDVSKKFSLKIWQ